MASHPKLESSQNCPTDVDNIDDDYKLRSCTCKKWMSSRVLTNTLYVLTVESLYVLLRADALNTLIGMMTL